MVVLPTPKSKSRLLIIPLLIFNVPASVSISVLLAIIFVLLPVQIVYKDSLFSPVGVSSNFIYILVILCSMASGILIILNRHNFKNKKYWALLFMVLFYLIVLLVDDNYIDILIVNPCTVLLTFFMFYTIDDSNIKLIANFKNYIKKIRIHYIKVNIITAIKKIYSLCMLNIYI